MNREYRGRHEARPAWSTDREANRRRMAELVRRTTNRGRREA